MNANGRTTLSGVLNKNTDNNRRKGNQQMKTKTTIKTTTAGAPAKSKKPIINGKNKHRNLPKAFRGSGYANSCITMSSKRFMRDAVSYMKTAAYKKSEGHVIDGTNK